MTQGLVFYYMTLGWIFNIQVEQALRFVDQYWSMRLILGVQVTGFATPTSCVSRFENDWMCLRLAG